MVISMKVCLGGTFYPFHKGHKKLLRKAFQMAGEDGSVFIGVTSAAMAKNKGKIASFQQRKRAIELFLSEENVLKQALIQPLSDKFGPTIQGDFEAIIVSPETKPTAEEINQKRKQQRKKPLQIIIVPFVLAEDNQPISSTRIRKKEIDENGTVLPQD